MTEQMLSVLDSRLSRLIGGIDNPSVTAALAAWSRLLDDAFDVYASMAIQMILDYRSNTAVTPSDVEAVLRGWRTSLERLVEVAAKRNAEVMTDLGKNRRAAAAMGNGGVPVGSIRTRFGEQQVYVDGGWFALGARRAP